MVQPFENQAYRKERQNSTAGGNIYPPIRVFGIVSASQPACKGYKQRRFKDVSRKALNVWAQFSVRYRALCLIFNENNKLIEKHYCCFMWQKAQKGSTKKIRGMVSC